VLKVALERHDRSSSRATENLKIHLDGNRVYQALGRASRDRRGQKNPVQQFRSSPDCSLPILQLSFALVCCGRSRVCDLSPGGLFLSTPVPPPLGAKAKLDFLVQEGQIRAEAVVRHFVPGSGLGLKFTAITDKDCPQLVALLKRIRSLSSTTKVPSFQTQYQ
jgi:hypothetical protein